MREPSLAAQVHGKSVYDVIAGARRAQHAMLLEGVRQPTVRPDLDEMLPEQLEAAAAPYLNRVRNFLGKQAQRRKKALSKGEPLAFAHHESVERSRFSQPDDNTPADALWLSFCLLSLPGLQEHKIKPQLRGGQMATRGAWRRAVAALVQKPPMAYAKAGGALMTRLSEATKATVDIRCAANYCAQPAWDRKILAFGQVGSKIHGQDEGECSACGR